MATKSAIEILKQNLPTSKLLGVTFDDYSTFDIKPLGIKFSITNLKEKEHIADLDYQEVIDMFQSKKKNNRNFDI